MPSHILETSPKRSNPRRGLDERAAWRAILPCRVGRGSARERRARGEGNGRRSGEGGWHGCRRAFSGGLIASRKVEDTKIMER